MPRKRQLPPGMWVRGRTYYARFRCNGREIRRKLASDFSAAKMMLADLRARAERGDFGLLDLNYPWADLKAMFLRWAQQNIRHPEDYERDLLRFERTCHIRNVRQVTPAQIDVYRNERLDDGVTARTVNREVGTVSNMLNKGVERFKVIDHNPIADVKPLPHAEPAKERRSLTLIEVEALFEHSPEHLKPVWRMFMTTGIRKSELVDLRFDDVDFARQTINIRASVAKGRKAREIPLDDTMMGLLVELKEKAADREPVPGGSAEQTRHQAANFTRDHVFVTQVNTPLQNNLLRAFYSICRRAGIEGAERHGNVDIHSLRVSFTTLSIEHGANPRAVQAILGHSTLAMTMGVYAKATDRGKRHAIGALPFATVNPPTHVVPFEPGDGAKRAQIAHNSSQTPENTTKTRVGRA